MNRKFKTGNRIKLKDLNSPEMIVMGYLQSWDYENQIVLVSWMDINNKLQEAEFEELIL